MFLSFKVLPESIKIAFKINTEYR